jgi:prepilin-type N-terminal cleavage/methylation domain-containing protein
MREKRAFSMIELIFVIVIIAIISAVAVPKFSSIQDDALISAEKSSIAVARKGLLTLYGKRVVRGDDFSITLHNFEGEEFSSKVYFSQGLFPVSLSVKTNIGGVDTDNNLSFGDLTAQYDRRALSLVVEPEDLIEWEKIDGTENSTQRWKGPASRFVKDQNGEISNINFWEYNNSSGKIFLK